MGKKREELFASPSAKYRGKPFWSWNGKLEKQELLRQIDIMKEMGFGGYFMHSRTGLETEYLGEEWFELTNACVEYGKAVDMESWIYDEDRWPSGSAGGIVTRDEQYRSRYLWMKCVESGQYSDRMRDEKTEVVFACRMMNGMFGGYRLLAQGELPEAGETAVLFWVETAVCSDTYNGFTYLDTMNAEAVQKYLEVTHEAYAAQCGEELGTGIRGVFTDEPHRGALFSPFSEGNQAAVPYTGDLFVEFACRFGYDLKSCLPELFFRQQDSPLSKTARDYVELCQQLFLERFVRPIQDWCRGHGMIFTGHMLHEDSLTAQTVMQGSLMRSYEYMDYPGIDLLAEKNECWWVAKQISSVARQLDKKWVLSELYGCTGWQMDFQAYKNIGDWQALFGINLRCPHLSWYTMKGEAKRDYPASIFYQSAWYEEYAYLETYYSRIHTLLQGRPVCGLLVINPIESVWARTYSGAFSWLDAADEGIQKLEERYQAVFRMLCRHGIDFDYGEEDILARHGSVRGSELLVGDMKYQKVLVTGAETLRESTVQLLEEFTAAGGQVIFAGEVPAYVDVKLSDRCCRAAERSTHIPFEEQEIVDNCRSGKEVCVKGDAEGRIFSQSYQNELGRVIMLLNMDREQAFSQVEICLEGSGAAELWDARSGKVYPLQNEASEEGSAEERSAEDRIARAGTAEGGIPEAGTADGSTAVCLRLDFAPGEEKLLLIREDSMQTKQVYSGDLESSRAQMEQTEVCGMMDTYEYELSEKNICVLDIPEVETCDGLVIGRREVLKADRALRDHLNLEYRGGEMKQPWYQKKFDPDYERPLTHIKVRYTIWVEEITEDIELAVEDYQMIERIELNQQAVSCESVGSWIDPCFDRIQVPAGLLKSGENRLEIHQSYRKSAGLEAVYLLGAFGVRIEAEGIRPVLTKRPDRLHVGDISEQGFPFYSGKIAYKIEGLQGKCVNIKFSSIGGAAVKLLGKTEELIAFQPYQAEIEDLSAIEIALTRRNTFGPLHQIPAKAYAYGPGNFLTDGREWQDAYVRYPQGLVSAPIVTETRAVEESDR